MIHAAYFDPLAALFDQVSGKIAYLALIGAQGVRGRRPLVRQHRQEASRQLGGLRLHWAPLLVARGWWARCTAFNLPSARWVYTWVVEISACPNKVCTVLRSAPFSTMWVAQL